MTPEVFGIDGDGLWHRVSDAMFDSEHSITSDPEAKQVIRLGMQTLCARGEGFIYTHMMTTDLKLVPHDHMCHGCWDGSR